MIEKFFKRAVTLSFILGFLGSVYGADQPNFLFIIVDDLGWADVGMNNPNTFYETPNMDALAKEGLLFKDGYVGSSMCTPSRAGIMTGKSPGRLHMTNWIGAPQAETHFRNTIFRNGTYVPALPLEEVTIAEAMRDGGYETYFIGKWHLGKSPKYWPEHQGFDTNVAGCAWNCPIGPGKYFAPYGIPTLPEGPEGEHLPDRLARETIQFLKQEHDRPFFTYLSFYSVHAPWMAPEHLVEKYRKKEKANPAKRAWREERWADFAMMQVDPVYAAMIEAMDSAIGRVLDALKSTGLDKNTVVIFISDNGGTEEVTSNAPLRAGKCYLYEGGIRVPFVVSWPGHIEAGSVTDIPVTSTDFYPTMLELAGIPLLPEQHLDGVSFAPLLHGDQTFDRGDIFWHFPHYEGGAEPVSAIRSGDWKLLHFYEDNRTELYNLREDIGEYHNLSVQYPERAANLLKKLDEYRTDIDAVKPTVNPKYDPNIDENYKLTRKVPFNYVPLNRKESKK